MDILRLLDLDEMTDLSVTLRERLNDSITLTLPSVREKQQSEDGTVKWLLDVGGAQSVEMVFIPEDTRGTLCVSSQVGCSLDCSFCATGKQGFNRDLTCAEIIGQVWIAAKSFGQLTEKGPRKITNVVMMGMGEPLLNFDNSVDAMNLMMHDFCYGLSKRRVTLSTSGVVPMLDKLGEHTDACLAISLHAANDEKRSEIMEINDSNNLEALADSLRYFYEKTKSRVTFEYIIFKDFNDSLEDAKELADFCRNVPVKINIIEIGSSGKLYIITKS